jgi:uncharacterized protein (DUF58 family)
VIPKELFAALRTIEIVTARLANVELSGSYHSSFRGQGLAFREVRPYQPGDDVRTIDWNVSARMNEPFVKVFTEEREMTVMLAIDLSQSARFGTIRAPKTHLATEVSALLAFSAIKNGDRVGLVLAGSEVEKVVIPRRGEKHVMRVVREVLTFAPTRAPRTHLARPGAAPPLGAQTDVRGLLDTLVRLSKRRSIAFVISDFFDEGYERTLALASAKHDVVPIVLRDPRDFELPDVGLAVFEDLESGETIEVDTASKSVRKHYADAMQALKAAQLRMFRKLGLDHVEVSTAGPYLDPLRQLFLRRARRLRG